jgi:hypothetical protein
MFFGQYDQGSNSINHYGIVRYLDRYSRHSFDFYYNCTLINSIYHEFKSESEEHFIRFYDTIYD